MVFRRSESSSEPLFSTFVYFKADIWSLGCVIVRMAVGEENRLFHNDTELIDKSRVNQQVKSVKGILEGGLTLWDPRAYSLCRS